jgi:small subunit ribosomal protein S20
MAQHRSAEKRHRQSLKRRTRNRHYRATVRNAIRKARSAAETRAPEAAAQIHNAERVLRRAASKGILHSKTISRTVSRLAKLLNRTTANA